MNEHKILFDRVKLEKDIYYKSSYTELYIFDDGLLFEFCYKEGPSYLRNLAIKRRICSVAGVTISEELYDLESHYGYCGPITNSNCPDFLKRAFSAYKKRCIEEKIVSEFIRFHPFNMLGSHSDYFDFHIQERTVVVVDLIQSPEERWSQYSKTTRNIIRKTTKRLLPEINAIPLSTFCDLYRETMKNNAADAFYYFNNGYFDALSRMYGVDLISVKAGNEVASCGFFMNGDDLSHYHLSANNSLMLKENGNYALLEIAFEHARSQGCSYFLMGGGRTSSKNDTLFRFKTKFSKLTLPFYIAGAVYIRDQYERLNDIWKKERPNSNIERFQKYRAE